MFTLDLIDSSDLTISFHCVGMANLSIFAYANQFRFDFSFCQKTVSETFPVFVIMSFM